MTAEVLAPELSALTDDELAGRYAAGSEAEQAAVLALLARRDELDARRRQAQARRAPVDSEWEAAAYSQYLEAERATNGYLLSRAGQVAGIDPWPALWTGPESLAMKRASEELREFWYSQRRITVCAYRDQVRDAYRIDAEWCEMNTGEATEAPERVPATPPADTNPPMAAERLSAPDAVTTTTEDAPMRVITYAARSAVRAQRQQAARTPRPAKRPNAPLSFGEAMDPARRKAWTAATFGPRTSRASAAVAVPEGATMAPRPAVGPASGTVVQTAPIDGDRVLRQVYGYLGHMAVWPSQAAQITATLYAAACWARDDKTQLPVWLYMPRLFFTSREGGSGKSRMSRLVAALCPGGKRLAEMTKASLIDLIAQRHTVVCTELDVAVGTGKRTQWLTGLLNVGYENDGMTSRKQGGKVQEIPLFGPVILDGLDSVIHSTGVDLKTLMSRCIIVHTEKAPEGYRAPRYDREKQAIAAAIGMRLARWMAQEVKEGIGDRVPEMPEHLGNRPHDLWEPLAAVAEAAGGDWPQFARYACEHIESSTGLPGDDERESDRIDSALEAWDAPAPEWEEEG